MFYQTIKHTNACFIVFRDIILVVDNFDADDAGKTLSLKKFVMEFSAKQQKALKTNVNGS